MSNDLSAIVNGEPERLATRYTFTEGPLWHTDAYLLFTDIRESQLYRWYPGFRPFLIREDTGGGNGLTFDGDGNVLMCQGDNRQLVCFDQEWNETIVADRWEGKRLNRPNDVVCRSDGMIYFTDPGGRVAPEQREIDVSGVMRIGSDGVVQMATADCEYPNGLAFSLDERVLYVANSRPDKYIRAFDVEPDGSLTNSRVFADLSAPEEEVPDGMKVDSEGRVFCTGPGGTWVFETGGELVGIIRTPEVPANLAFGGSDLRTIFFTARTSVYTLRVRTPGMAARYSSSTGGISRELGDA